MNLFINLMASISPSPGPKVVDVIDKNTNELAEKIADFITGITEQRAEIIFDILFVVFVFVVARIVLIIVTKLTSVGIKNSEKNPDLINSKRTHTILSLFRSFARYSVYIVALLIVLVHFGFMKSQDVLSGAGVSALVLGFGAQSIVNDVFSGLFLVFENQFSVGDHIKIDEAEGIVEATALRVTYIRTFRGERFIVPNGKITTVINYTHSSGFLAGIEVAVSYDTNTRSTMKIIDNAVQMYAQKKENIIVGKPEVLGISEFKESYLLIKVICKAKTYLAQLEIERGMRLAVKEAFDASNILFPYPSYRVINVKKDKKEKEKEEIVSVNRLDKKDKNIHIKEKPIWQIDWEHENNDK